MNEVKSALQEIFLFKSLTKTQMERVVTSMHTNDYQDQQDVVQAGDDAEHFFLIHTGNIEIIVDGVVRRVLGKWDYFGERGLLFAEKRSATCRARGAVTCLVLEARIFLEIVGSFKTALMHRIKLQDENIKMTDLVATATVGEGPFGTVLLVHAKKDDTQAYALKRLRKEHVVKHRLQKQVQVERELLCGCYHPFIVQFIKTFQDERNIYFLTEFLEGGDLFGMLRDIGIMQKWPSQFYAGSIILAVEYLHEKGYMHRDIKPENVALDGDGWCKLLDFLSCKKALRAHTLVGTPEYMAPEIILGRGYNCCIDWWSVGVCCFEFICGPLPYGHETEDHLELFRQVVENQLNFPSYVKDPAAIQLIRSLLERFPEQRLGSSSAGAKDIKDHPFFADMSWDSLLARDCEPPFMPNLRRVKKHWQQPQHQPWEQAFQEDDHYVDLRRPRRVMWSSRHRNWDQNF